MSLGSALAIPLIACGSKAILHLGSEALGLQKSPEILEDIAEIVGGLGGNLAASEIATRLQSLPVEQLGESSQRLTIFSGLVLEALVKSALSRDEFALYNIDLQNGLPHLPGCWNDFVALGHPDVQTLSHQNFVHSLSAVLLNSDPILVLSENDLRAFFAIWLNKHVGKRYAVQNLHFKLADVINEELGKGIAGYLTDNHPIARAAFEESLIRYHAENQRFNLLTQGHNDWVHDVLVCTQSQITEIRKGTVDIHNALDGEAARADQRHSVVTGQLDLQDQQLQQQTDMLQELRLHQDNQNFGSRLSAYKHALLTAFRPYQELALDNYAAADQVSPDIWDIFVHPACANSPLRPEDMDAAQRGRPPQNPAQDLLPLLAQDEYRRTVLLADPGMGKSTFIQALIAHLASGRTLLGASAISRLVPVPLVLRDLVPLLHQDELDSWSWEGLLTLFIQTYRREEAALPLCYAFSSHQSEFLNFLLTAADVFFLVDGLDEIGDLEKRQKILDCLQSGIRSVNRGAHWLITSRLIGYDLAPVHLVQISEDFSVTGDAKGADIIREATELRNKLNEILRREWDGYACGDATTDIKIGVAPNDLAHFGNAFASKEKQIDGRKDTEYSFISWGGISVARQLYLAPFDDQRQDRFTRRWFRHRHSNDYSAELMREVREHHHDGVRIISRVPNLLCMMNILKRSGKPLPDGRAALYDEIVKAYLGGIDSAYRLRPVLGTTCPFDPAQRRFLLSLLGAHMQQRRTTVAVESTLSLKSGSQAENKESSGNLLISRPELEELLTPIIQSMMDNGSLENTQSAAALLDELLRHISSRSGLLIPRSSDSAGNILYGFTHLSFLEFFAAEWLALEFDRRQRQLARQSEAQQDGFTLSVEDLEAIFPPLGPIQHDRASFSILAGSASWHESLVFLMESRKNDSGTLLRWLFPALHRHVQNAGPSRSGDETPLISIDAVQLLVKLAKDQELAVPLATRESWWKTLWSAYLYQQPKAHSWPIAPILLGRNMDRAETLRCLGPELVKNSGEWLHLNDCVYLTSSDLLHLSGVEQLTKLDLSGCTGLNDTEGFETLTSLKGLDLSRCFNLRGPNAFRGLTNLKIQTIWLHHHEGMTPEEEDQVREQLGSQCDIYFIL